MTTIHNFPVELIAQVCENLDTKGLRKARLISKSIFEQEARKLLFREVVLYANTKSLKKLEQIAENFDSLVRVFTYSGKMVRFYRDWELNFREYLKAVTTFNSQKPASLLKLDLGDVAFDGFREHHALYCEAVQSQGCFLRDDLDIQILPGVLDSFPALETVIYDTGHDLTSLHFPSPDLTSVTSKVLVPFDAFGGYKRHPRQLQALLRAIASRRSLVSRVKKFITLGVDTQYFELRGQEFNFALALDLKKLFATFTESYRSSLSTNKKIANMLTCCTNLEALSLQYVSNFTRHLRCRMWDSQSFSGCIGKAMQSDADWGCRIETVNLRGFYTGTREFKNFLIRCSPTLRNLSLSDMVLFAADEVPSLRHDEHSFRPQDDLTDDERPGCWISIFVFMATHLNLVECDLSGTFKEGHSDGDRTRVGVATKIVSDPNSRLENFITGRGASPFTQTTSNRWVCKDDV